MPHSAAAFLSPVVYIPWLRGGPHGGIFLDYWLWKSDVLGCLSNDDAVPRALCPDLKGPQLD